VKLKPQKPYRILRCAAEAVIAALLLMMTFGGPVRSAADAGTCRVEPPVRALDLPRYYSDADKSVVDPAKLAANKAATRSVRKYTRSVVRAADRAWTAPDQATRDRAAACAAERLLTWATVSALLGEMKTRQAEYERKWTLAALSLATLKIADRLSSQDAAKITAWLTALADRSYAFAASPGRIRNNHWYWAGLGQAATSMVVASTHSARRENEHDEVRLWRRAQSIFRDAMSDIDADGLLAKEAERGRRALHYHVFSVMPLVVMAELAAHRGEDWWSTSDGALERLVALVARAIRNPETFPIAGQERPINTRAGWAYLVVDRFGQATPAAALPEDVIAKRSHRLIGGDARVLKSALDALSARRRSR